MPENFHQLLNKFQYHLMEVIKILRSQKNGDFFYDSRPLVRLNVNISVEKNGKIETGSLRNGRKIYV